MPTLIAGSVLTALAIVSLAVSIWQNGRAEDAGRRAADASLDALRAQRAGEAARSDEQAAAGGAVDAHRAEEERLLRTQRRHATVAYGTKRAAMVVLTIGLLGVVGGALVTFG